MFRSARLRRLVRTPILGRALLAGYRTRLVWRYQKRSAGDIAGWLLRSREYDNWTYPLDARNRLHLPAFLAAVTGVTYEEADGYLREIEEDAALRHHVLEQLGRLPEPHDDRVDYGRRIGWYAAVRILRPRVVVETGIEKGLGAVVLAAALLRNRADGHPGTYYGTDINPEAGALLSGPYAAAGQILYGDSIESLRALDAEIDLFINDSDHSAAYEGEEYRVVQPKLSERAVVLGDNAHCTDELLRWARETGRRYLYWQERPARGWRWYPGAGIGAAW